MTEDNAIYLREWAADIRKHSGKSVDADRCDAIAAEIEQLRSRLVSPLPGEIAGQIEFLRKLAAEHSFFDFTTDETDGIHKAAAVLECFARHNPKLTDSEAFEDREYWASLHQCAIDLLGRAEKAEAALQQQAREIDLLNVQLEAAMSAPSPEQAREIEGLKEILQFDPKSKAKTWAQAWSEADDEIERLRIRIRRLETERDSLKSK